jgi:hypothetical protein
MMQYIRGSLGRIIISAEVEIIDFGPFADFRELEEVTIEGGSHCASLDGLRVARHDP